MTIGTLTVNQREKLDRNLLAFYDARERLQHQLQNIVADWKAVFDTMGPAWQETDTGRQAWDRINTLWETARVLDEDAVLPIGEFDLSIDDERLDLSIDDELLDTVFSARRLNV